MNEVLEAIVARLLDALGMEACDVYEVDADDGSLKLLVSYEDWAFDEDVSVGRVFALEEFASSALAISTRRPVLVSSPDDPRLSEIEAELFRRYGHRTQLSVPLRIRDRVIGLVEVFDNRESRSLSAEQIQLANAICRFAALALDKARLYDEQRRTADRLDRLAGSAPAAPGLRSRGQPQAGDRGSAGGPRRGGPRRRRAARRARRGGGRRPGRPARRAGAGGGDRTAVGRRRMRRRRGRRGRRRRRGTRRRPPRRRHRGVFCWTR